MNPFDLNGPEFLVFYLALTAFVIIGLVLARRALESSAAPKIDLSDPYLIAYLRGSEPELLRVATVSLIDRGLLLATGTQLERANKDSFEFVRRPVEKALLQKFARPDEAASIFDDSHLKATCKPYEQTLKNAGLLPNETIDRARWSRLLIACFVLAGFGIVKLLVAYARGRSNVGFLIALMFVAIFIAVKVSFPRLTESGKAMIADLQNLYSGLKDRASFVQPGGATIEPMLLAAVFGVGALQGSGFAFTHALFPRVKATSAAVASCGASCGSSSCGSSCGGGCGGGCGGCGG